MGVLLYTLYLIGAVVLGLSAYDAYRYQKERKEHRPITVSAWVPWIGSTLRYRKDPAAFLQKCQNRYGPVFAVTLAGRRLTFVTTPSLISAVYRNPNSFAFDPHKLEIANLAYGISESSKHDDKLVAAVFPLISHHLSKSSIDKFSSNFGPHLWNMIHRIVKPPQNQTSATLRLKDFVFSVIYAATAGSLFGPHFPISDTFEDFQIFDEGFQLLAIGAPGFLVAKPLAARARLQERIGRYAEENWVGQGIPGASELISGLTKLFREWDCPRDDIGGRLLNIMRAATSNAMWTMYWFWVYQLQSPDHLSRLKAEVDNYIISNLRGKREKIKEMKPLQFEDPAFSLHLSAMYETLRLATSISSIRKVLRDTDLRASSQDSTGYILRRGEDLLTSSRLVHLDPEIYDNPMEYRIDRYLEKDGVTHRQFFKEGKLLPSPMLGWGGGTSLCQGRHFATYEIHLFSAVCLAHFDISPLYVIGAKGQAKKGSTFPEQLLSRTGVFFTNDDLLINVRRRSIWGFVFKDPLGVA